jgi:hypothetical protein
MSAPLFLFYLLLLLLIFVFVFLSLDHYYPTYDYPRLPPLQDILINNDLHPLTTAGVPLWMEGLRILLSKKLYSTNKREVEQEKREEEDNHRRKRRICFGEGCFFG